MRRLKCGSPPLPQLQQPAGESLVPELALGLQILRGTLPEGVGHRSHVTPAAPEFSTRRTDSVGQGQRDSQFPERRTQKARVVVA